jgi:hypothetical protein
MEEGKFEWVIMAATLRTSWNSICVRQKLHVLMAVVVTYCDTPGVDGGKITYLGE